jgi:Uncharacterized conserved protein
MPPDCLIETPFTGTSVAMVNRGFEDKFIKVVEEAKLVTTAKRFDGNIDYKLLQNVMNPREFRFIETWKDRAAVDKWINKGLPSTLFKTEEMVKTLAGGKLTNFEAYKNIGVKKM